MRILAAALLLALLVFPLLPVGSVVADNTTSVGITYSENISLGDIKTDLGPGAQAIADNITKTINTQMSLLTSIAEKAFEAFLLLGFLSLTIWRRDEPFLWVVTSLVTAFVAFSWFKNYPGISIVLLGLACYLLYQAVRLALFRKSKENTE
jgi:hypothetical protein